MYRRLLDGAVIVLILMQLWQWWPVAYEEFAEPDDTIALFETVEAARPDSPRLMYAEPELDLSRAELLFATSSEGVSNTEIFSQARQSTVVLVGYDEWGDRILGAGVILTADGLIATNEHIVAGLTELYVVLPDQTTIIAVETVLYSDFANDLALLRIDSDPLRPVTLSQTEPVVGDPVLTLGHPELFLYSLSDGIVSGTRTYSNEGGRFLQMTAPVNYGSSGGPVFNQAGALVGLVSWSLEYEQNIQNVEGLHFAVPTAAIVGLFTE